VKHVRHAVEQAARVKRLQRALDELKVRAFRNAVQVALLDLPRVIVREAVHAHTWAP
jgi:hypothetical protein